MCPSIKLCVISLHSRFPAYISRCFHAFSSRGFISVTFSQQSSFFKLPFTIRHSEFYRRLNSDAFHEPKKPFSLLSCGESREWEEREGQYDYLGCVREALSAASLLICMFPDPTASEKKLLRSFVCLRVCQCQLQPDVKDFHPLSPEI